MKHSLVSRIVTLTALCGSLPAFGCSGADEPLSEEEQAMIDESQAIEEADLAQAQQAIGESTCIEAYPDVFSSVLNGLSPTTYGSDLCFKGFVVYAGSFVPIQQFFTTVIKSVWADAKPTTKAACESAMTSLYLYREGIRFGAKGATGTWNAPGEPAGCKVPSVTIDIPITIAGVGADGEFRSFDAGNEGKAWRAVATARTTATGPTRKVRIYSYGK